MNLTVALVQLDPCPTEAQALAVGLVACRQARALGAEIVLFPELWNIGYALPSDQVLSLDSDFLRAFANEARVLGLIVAITFLEKTEGRPQNSVALFDKTGRLVHTYAKVHTCDFGSEACCQPGSGFSVCTVDTSVGPVTLGTMICFDREFPESARVLMLQGAEIILVPNACEMEQNRRNQLQSRAFENMTGIALANYASGEGNGHSVAFDGMAFAYDEANDRAASRDQVLVEAGEAPGIYLATFPLDQMRAYRSAEVWGDAYRKVGAYGLLTRPRLGSSSRGGESDDKLGNTHGFH